TLDDSYCSGGIRAVGAMVDSIINTTDVSDADIVILSANYDGTSSIGKGADKGPAAVVACLLKQIVFYERFTGTNPAQSLRIAHHDPGNLNHLSPDEMVDTLQKIYRDHAEARRFVLMLGGEHSVTIGPARALAAVVSPAECTIVHIDAHFDLRNDDSDYSDPPHGKNAHSCVMRRVSELGFPIVHVGIRTYSEDELRYAREHACMFFEWGKGNPPPPGEIIDTIKTEKVYLSIDVDGIDPAYMPGTGTPVQGGLEWYYAIDLVQTLIRRKGLIGADIVEVSPRPYDTRTEYGAAQLAYMILAFKTAYEKTRAQEKN
ncbi:MAG: agmatinase, partial [Parcubacteria group bacterium]|nr:agmatinase [Parcubacteria group bacterium]